MSITSDYGKTLSATPGTNNLSQGFLGKVGDFAKGAYNSIASPFVGLAATPVQLLAKATGKPDPYAGGIPSITKQNTPVSKLGVEQKLGDAAQVGSYFLGGEGAGAVGESAGLGSKVLSGVKTGATVGLAQGAGQAMSQGKGLSDVVSSGAKGAAIGGVVGGATGVASNMWDKAYSGTSGYQAGVDSAQSDLNTAAEKGVNAVNDMGGTMNDFKNDLGGQFSQAPKAVEATDPTARFSLSADTLQKLNDLKDTKAFQLPDYLRVSSPEFGGDVNLNSLGKEGGSGISLTPSQTQDLITQLDALTYKAKASGDLAINQQTVGLVNDLKNGAQNSFGHVTDPEGNSVWNRAYQDYRQGMDAVNAMSDIVNINNTPGGMSSPLDVNKSFGKIMDLSKTPQGKVILKQAVQQFKNVSGYDLTNPMETVGKMLEANDTFQKVVQGGYWRQVGQAMTRPSTVGRRLLFIGGSVLSIAAFGTWLRKQLTQ